MLIPQLAAWHISGIDTQARTIRKRLLPSCSSHGGQKPTGLMTHSLGGGLVGVIEGFRSFSGPVINVVNFLAHLHNEGYK